MVAANRKAREQQRIDDFNRANAGAIRRGTLKRAESVEEAR